MAVRKELVLYYTPEKSAADQKLKGVLVRLGIRIRNIGPEQILQKTGYLAGLPGFAEEPDAAAHPEAAAHPDAAGESEASAPIPENMLVFHGFSERRLQETLYELRRAKVPPIALKAVLTEYNCGWSFLELYEELRREHESMRAGRQAAHTAAGVEDAAGVEAPAGAGAPAGRTK